MMRRLIIFFIVVLSIATATWWLNRPVPIAVTLVEVAKGNVEASVANTRAGSVEACQRTRLSPISGGCIAFLGVKKGDYVKKGQVLLRLWNDDQQAQSHYAQTQVSSSQRRIEEICTLADNAEREAVRMAELHAKDFVSKSSEEKSRHEAKSKRAACNAARADMEQAQARVKVIKAEHYRTMLIAPFDGIVADIVGELGEYTTPSPPGVATPPVIDLIDNSCLYIEAPMDEVDAPKIRVGQSARVSLDALPGNVLPAHVKRVAPYVVAVEKQARTVDVEISLDNPDDNKSLLVGYSADVEIVLGRHDNALRIPTSAIIDGNKVLVYHAHNQTLEERFIKIGITNWEYSEVLEGLKQNDQIVVSLEREGVRAGAKVKPEPPTLNKPVQIKAN